MTTTISGARILRKTGVLGFPADSVVASPADGEGSVAKRVSEGVSGIEAA